MAKTKHINMIVNDRFEDFLLDWNYSKYLLAGGYGSGKSYSIAMKIIFKLFEEKRKCLIVRQVFGSIRESCFDLLLQILDEMDMIANMNDPIERKTKVCCYHGSMQFKFPNGSRIVFKGMDDPRKLKSINDVSIIWLEECTEISYDGYKELLGRLRTPNLRMYIILSCNPVGKESWVYRHFFKRQDNNGKEKIILDDSVLYKRKTIVKNNVYYHHSTVEDNKFAPKEYIATLDELREYDSTLYRIARLGRFGVAGIRVLPQLELARNAQQFKNAVRAIPLSRHYFGFDFGFEESYNALVSCAVDSKEKILYIYNEIYVNHLTDPQMVKRKDMQRLKAKQISMQNQAIRYNPIVADNEDPKAIAFYKDEGFKIRACRNKFAGSRISNTRKIKRFRKIIVSPKCIHTRRELGDLTFAKDRQGNVLYDQFNIDAHTFSALWYALDTVNVSNPKEIKRHSMSGNNTSNSLIV